MPKGPVIPPAASKVGGKSTYVRVIQAPDGGSANYTPTGCLALPLKSGGVQKIESVQFAGAHARTLRYEDTWSPAGTSRVFSFLPVVQYYEASGPTTFRGRVNSRGLRRYIDLAGENDVPYVVYFDTTYWTEFDQLDRTYFEYWAGTGIATSNKLFGRPNRSYDTAGNELSYVYQDNAGGKPLLRKIVGYAGGVVPYFEYADETIDATRFAPITKVQLIDTLGTNAPRTIYFEYENVKERPYLRAMINPAGCATQYGSLVDDHWGISCLESATDPEGYASYFQYDLSGWTGTGFSALLNRAVEPNGLVTYYEYVYSPGLTKITQEGRPSTMVGYVTSTDLSTPRVAGWLDPLGRTTYFLHDTSLGRMLRRQEANANVTYFGYVGGGSSTGYNRYALRSVISPFNGAGTYYEYDGVTFNLSKIVHARHVAGSYPVVTYYRYDARQAMSALVTVLGETTLYGRDSLGRLIRFQDARGYPTYYSYGSSAGFMDSLVAADGGISYYGYDSYGSRVRAVSPRWANEGGFPSFTSYFGYDLLGRLIRQVDPLGQVSYFDWTSRGDLLATTDPRGTSSEYAYDGLSRETQNEVSDATGKVLGRRRVGYDLYRNPVRVQDALDHTVYFGYNDANKPVRVLDPLSRATYFAYDAVDNLTVVVDPANRATYHFYDQLSRNVSRRDALGNQEYYFYDLGNNRTHLIDARLNATYFFYDKLDRNNVIRDANGGLSYFFFDERGHLACARDARSNETYFFYDGMARRKATRDALGQFTYYSYDLAGNLTEVVDASGRMSTTFFDALDRARIANNAAGESTYFFYDAVGNLTVSRDARGNSSYFAYDGLGRRTASQDALGNVAYFFWDAQGNLTIAKDVRGSLSYFAYDALNRPSRLRLADSAQLDREYDLAGNLSHVRETYVPASGGYGSQAYGTTPYGGWTQTGTYFFYDAMDRPSVTRDAQGGATYYFYDPVGNRCAIRDPLGRTTYYGYDNLDRLARTQDGLGSSSYFEYDAVGNLTRALDSDGHELNIRYDALGRRDSLLFADGGSAYFTFDTVSNLDREIAPRGNATYYGYDAENRLTRLRDSLGRTLYFEYDPVGNLSRYVDAEGASSAHTYDAVNRRTRTDYTAAGSVVLAGFRLDPYYGYDEVGNLTQMGDLWGLHRMGYDVRNRPLRHQFPAGQVLYFEYNARLQPTALVYPATAGAARMDYDNLFRQTKVQAPTGFTAYFIYDVASQLTRKVLGNGTKLDVTYDAAGRIQNWRYSTAAGASLTYFDYSRDAKGLITKVVREAVHTVYHSYDANDRLTSEIWALTGANPPEVYGYRYAYDVAGNRIRARKNGVDTYYFYDQANQLTVRGADAAYATPTYYIYDLNGSLTDQIEPGGTTKFAYNPAGMVARIRWQDSTSTYFLYDGRLQRYGMVENGTSSYFLWDGLNALEELNPDFSAKERLTYRASPIAGIAQVVESYRPGEGASLQRTYPLMDPRGSITKWHQSDGSTILASQEYDAFGETIPNSAAGTWPNRFSYQGQAWMKVSSGGGGQSLLISPFRIYNPADGRFLQSDPLRQTNYSEGGCNLALPHDNCHTPFTAKTADRIHHAMRLYRRPDVRMLTALASMCGNGQPYNCMSASDDFTSLLAKRLTATIHTCEHCGLLRDETAEEYVYLSNHPLGEWADPTGLAAAATAGQYGPTSLDSVRAQEALILAGYYTGAVGGGIIIGIALPYAIPDDPCEDRTSRRERHDSPSPPPRDKACSCTCYSPFRKGQSSGDSIGQVPGRIACASRCLSNGYARFKCGNNKVFLTDFPNTPAGI